MRSGRFLALTVVVGLVAACTGTASPSPAPTSPPATSGSGPTEAPTPTPNPLDGMTVNAVKAGDHAFDDVSLGYWIQHMKDAYGVTVNLTATASADISLRAIVSGAADSANAMNLTGVVNLVQQSGTDVKLVAADTYASDYVLLTSSSITDPKQLEGKKAAISAPGDASELVQHICLNAEGVDYSKITLVRIGGTSARVAAVTSGAADVGAAHIADATAAVNASNGALHVLLDCGKAVGNYPVTGMTLTGAYISAHKDLVQALVNGYVDAQRWAASNKDAYLQFALTWVPDSPPDQASAAYDYFKSVNFWSVNGGISQADLQTYLGYAAQTGVLSGKIPTTDKWVDDSFVQNYLAANGTQ
jgi:ABC-type nitrate/sulfonate/bicarbonate transport system substrate-binding protein